MARTEQEKQALLRKIEELSQGGPGWWHVIDFGDGIKTPVRYNWKEREQPLYHIAKLDEMGLLPKEMRGLRVLDVGAFSGGYSIEFARRGARVTAIDPVPCAFRQLSLVNEELKLGMDVRQFDALDCSEKALGRFDIVCCLGLIYHCPHPLLLLQRISEVCDNMLILESQTHNDRKHSEWMRFLEKDYGLHDESNWWIPGVEAMRGMMRTVGFARTQIVPHPLPSRAIVAGWKKSIVSRRDLSISRESRQIIVRHAGKELTAGLHVHSAYRSGKGYKEFQPTPEAWCNSADERLFQQVDIPTPGRLVVKNDYYFWDMEEIWEIGLQSDGEISFQVHLALEKKIDLRDIQVNFMLAGGYDLWGGNAPATDKIPGVTHPVTHAGRGVVSVSFGSSRGALPGIAIECDPSSLPGPLAVGVGPGPGEGGPLLRFSTKVEGLEAVRRVIFKGSPRVIFKGRMRVAG